MTIFEPQITKAPDSQKQNRWRWWYANICDFRLLNPGCTNKQIAAHLQKSEHTIGAIIRTDMYLEYEAQRRARWRSENESMLRDKLTSVASLALDSMEAQFKKKLDQVPLELSREVAISSLDRLGFSPKTGPAVLVQTNNDNRSVVLPGAVNISILEEARMAIRAVEAQRLMPQSVQIPMEAEPALDVVSHQSESSAQEPESTVEVIGGPSAIDS